MAFFSRCRGKKSVFVTFLLEFLMCRGTWRTGGEILAARPKETTCVSTVHQARLNNGLFARGWTVPLVVDCKILLCPVAIDGFRASMFFCMCIDSPGLLLPPPCTPASAGQYPLVLDFLCSSSLQNKARVDLECTSKLSDSPGSNRSSTRAMFSAEDAPVLGQPQGFFMGTQQAQQFTGSSEGIPKEEKSLFPSMDGPDLCDFEVVQTESHFTEAKSAEQRSTAAGSQSPRSRVDPAVGGSLDFSASGPDRDSPTTHNQTNLDPVAPGRRYGGTPPTFNTSDQSSHSLRSDRDSGTTPRSYDSNTTGQSHSYSKYRGTYADPGCAEENSLAVQFMAGGCSRGDQPQGDRMNEFGTGARDVAALTDGMSDILLASNSDNSGLLGQMNRAVQMMQRQLEQQAAQLKTLTSLVSEMSAKLDSIAGGRTSPELQTSVNFAGSVAGDGRSQTADLARGRIVPPPLPRGSSQDPAPLAGSRAPRYNHVEDRSVAHRNALEAQRAAEAEALERKRLEELRAMERRKEEERKRKEEQERKRQEEAARRAAEEQRRREELEEKRKNIMSNLISGQARSSSLFGDDSGPANKNSLFDD
ncbi:hypothetical protein TGME49_234470 [Toxoplasma gondii ME49]|uniref:Transmembrane protein n=3 Tax=Toxoplasma gondii TaxID=5811 RepID=A0A086KNL3_TOXGO|nr:hypothetical protein TGME49_234470 [Toxoplasma gondii ME49]EPT26786.1 hypothetical protein TGME49_234470 [Toxoplasma gondii ME49]KFG45981.1 hypothetical protein TGDOM2_234470 [Toxoplasma gondii GAB2-2007-GAL-DOM2]KYF42352.1 hypothetical protein TGARI_234470 [Toxoplasma gondii ARI]|eukprot:XP_018635854.1 hypothetical protein TGME49_234470 [Toxoplasma gondii ME49]